MATVNPNSGPCPNYAPLIGALGAASCIALTALGSAYGTFKAGAAVCAVGVTHPELIMRAILPIIMAGVVGLFGLIVTAIMSGGFVHPYPLYAGALHLAGGLCAGFGGLAAGIALGVVGDAGVRGVAQQPRLYVGMMLILIFAEVLSLYGMIVGIMLVFKGTNGAKDIKC